MPTQNAAAVLIPLVRLINLADHAERSGALYMSPVDLIRDLRRAPEITFLSQSIDLFQFDSVFRLVQLPHLLR